MADALAVHVGHAVRHIQQQLAQQRLQAQQRACQVVMKVALLAGCACKPGLVQLTSTALARSL
jgi:hypothetical protein